MSTNCARMYLTLLSFRYFLADWGDIALDAPVDEFVETELAHLPGQSIGADNAATQFPGDFCKCFPEIGGKGGIAPEAITRHLFMVGADREYGDPDHLGHQPDPFLRTEFFEIYIACLHQQFVYAHAGERETRILTDHRIDPGSPGSKRSPDCADRIRGGAILEKEFASSQPRNHAGAGQRSPAIRLRRQRDVLTFEPLLRSRSLEPELRQETQVGQCHGVQFRPIVTRNARRDAHAAPLLPPRLQRGKLCMHRTGSLRIHTATDFCRAPDGS